MCFLKQVTMKFGKSNNQMSVQVVHITIFKGSPHQKKPTQYTQRGGDMGTSVVCSVCQIFILCMAEPLFRVLGDENQVPLAI